MRIAKFFHPLFYSVLLVIIINSSTALGETVILRPSGLAETSWYEYNGVWYPDFTVKTGNTWATALDTNDYDSSYAKACCGGPTKYFYAALDNPQGFDENTIILSIQVTVIGRYLTTPILIDPTPAEGDIDIGFRTGGTGSTTVKELQHHLNTPLGTYITATSKEYTKDPNGGELDINDINNLEIFVQRNIAGAYQLRVTQVYATVNYMTKTNLVPIYELLLKKKL